MTRSVAPYRHDPANTGHSPNAVSMLGQRRRRWTNIETALPRVCWRERGGSESQEHNQYRITQRLARRARGYGAGNISLRYINILTLIKKYSIMCLLCVVCIPALDSPLTRPSPFPRPPCLSSMLAVKPQTRTNFAAYCILLTALFSQLLLF